MNMNVETITVNGKTYYSEQPNQASTPVNGLKHAIVRTQSAGVFSGYIESQSGQEVTMVRARRLWQWAGAASLSQLAMEGTSDAKSCKFPAEVDRVKLFQVIEILDTTEKAKQSIDSVKVWKV